MTDVVPPSRSLQPEYEAKLAADLAQNTKEHERVTGQMAELAAELGVLEQNRALLLSLQQAVGEGTAKARTEDSIDSVADPEAGKPNPQPRARARGRVPAARKARGTKEQKTTEPSASSNPAKSAEAGGEAAKPHKAPSLAELVRTSLTGWSEPKSAVEVAKSLSEQHPDRTIKVNAVRMALESLVAKALVERSHQGRTVFYERVSDLGAGTQATDEPEPAEPAVG